jgi:ABC-type glycerol-3-phosphate transport system permease component
MIPPSAVEESTRPATKSVLRERLAAKGGWVVFSYAVSILAAVAAVFPFLYIISLSLKESSALVTYPPQWIPDPAYWGNYVQIVTETPFPRWMANTLVVAFVVTGVKLLIDSCAAYAFAKMDFPFKESLFIFALSMLMIPVIATLIPMFLVVKNLGLLNTFPGLILPGLASPLGIFLLRGFMEQLPRDLENAARLDGASELFILMKIIMPLSKPALVTLAIWLFLTQWTGFVWPLVATSSDDMRLLTNGLAGLKGQYVVNWGLIAAGTVLVVIPTVIAFVLFMRQFVAGSLAGALKQ